MPHLVDIHVGQRLKHLRVLRGLTQTDVAEGLGISFQQVQKYELGRNRISASKLYELGRILAVQPGYFFEGIDEDICPETAILDEEGARIASMLARIKDERLRSQIRSFISELANDQAA